MAHTMPSASIVSHATLGTLPIPSPPRPMALTMATASSSVSNITTGSRPHGEEGRGGSATTRKEEAPWPAKQRRRIDRIRDEKWGEFVKTINEQFEWLETYYQGCVVAANMQCKRQLEYEQQEQQHHHQMLHDDQSLESSGDQANIFMTPEQRRHHDYLSSPVRHPIFSTPLASSASLNATLFPGGRPRTATTPTQDRHVHKLSKRTPLRQHPRSPFRHQQHAAPTSPRSPLAALHSPQRTYRVTPRRVNLSATARKIGRERQARRDLKQQWHEEHLMQIDSGYIDGEEGDSFSLPPEGTITRHASVGRVAGDVEGREEAHAMDIDGKDRDGQRASRSFSSATTPANKQIQRQQQQQHYELKTPLNDTVAPPPLSDKGTTSSSSAKRSRSLIQSARTLETTIRSRRTEEVGGVGEEGERADTLVQEYQHQSLPSVKRSTPGSKARDSLGTVSPHYRAILMRSGGGSGGRSTGDNNTTRAEPVPGLRRGNHGATSSTLLMASTSIAASKRDSGMLERDMHDVDVQDGGGVVRADDLNDNDSRPHASKRARIPSYNDSTAPVRFESPEREPNSKSSRLSLEEQRVFGSSGGRLSSRTNRTTGGSGYEADLSSIGMAISADTETIGAGLGNERVGAEHHAYDDEGDAGYDSRMSAATTIMRPSENYRDTLRMSKMRPSLAESFEVLPPKANNDDGEEEEEPLITRNRANATAAPTPSTTFAVGGGGGDMQRPREHPTSTTTSTSQLHSHKKLPPPPSGRLAASASTSSALNNALSLDEPTDFPDLHTALPPASTLTNHLRQGRSVSSTDLLSSSASGVGSAAATIGASRAGAGISRVSNLKQGLKRSVSAIESSSTMAFGSGNTSQNTVGTGGSTGTLAQLKSRIPLTLPEKRTLGPRRLHIIGTTTSAASGGGSSSGATSGALQLMSRLLKSGQGLMSSTATATATGPDSGQTSSSLSVSSAATIASIRSSTTNTTTTSATVVRGVTPVSSSSSSSSTLMRPTESSLARSAEQQQQQNVKRSMLGGSTAPTASSSSVKATKAPNPFVAPSLARPPSSKAKIATSTSSVVSNAALPPPPTPQPTVLPEIGSDGEDQDLDDDLFPSSKPGTLTVASAVKGVSTATTTTISKKHVAGSSAMPPGPSSKANGVPKGAHKNKAAEPSSSSISSSKAKSELERTVSVTSTTSATSSSTSSSNSSSSTRKHPDWAQWDKLEEAMRTQRHINPRMVFGSLPTLDLGEMFPGKAAEFRERSSSAHWGYADRLTEAEVQQYEEDMGWE